MRLQSQRDTVTWFPLPLQNALYNAIYEQWIFAAWGAQGSTVRGGSRGHADGVQATSTTTPHDTEFERSECTHLPVPWQYMGDVMHLSQHIADCNMRLAVKGRQYTDIAPDGEDDVPKLRTPWVHRWWVPAVNNAKLPRLNLQMGDVAFAFVPVAWGFTKQPTLEVTAFSLMAHQWGAPTPVDNLRNSAQGMGTSGCATVNTRCAPTVCGVLARVNACFSARQKVI